MSLPPIGTGANMGLSGVLQLRAEILQKSQSLGNAAAPAEAQPTGFGGAMQDALKAVDKMQAQSGADAAAWEKGETQDIAAVMLSRQKASIAFEATLQARNRLLSAYRDIMNMPV
ncbi:flagellar hook-basal body complex protein FliE [Sandaracinobacter neustonicus]|uniref:Flagellar hook-basal body complex protein FliE n=1 Tax=Sandaracinobacter neustonicus TaxID=1715348 RepID=A0A501XHY4_9SPHN|nr:flagellar hook-basal body complex protein FliE [Sandaracinobacter neustonicus]TPE60150.1 flagellar hook-basal body complex protein FliE [Sandaracinobacter neustonicus]